MTDQRESGLIRETLYARANSQMRSAGLVREVLRSTATGAGTYIAVAGLVRETLRSSTVLSTGGTQARVLILA